MKGKAAIAIMGMGAALAASPLASRTGLAPPAAREAPVALLVDLASGQPLHAREADRRFLPASVAKVMTAYIAFEAIAAGRLTEDQRFTVDAGVAREWSGKGSSMFLRAGDEVRVGDLLRGITSVSANDGAIVLARGMAGSDERFVALMNRTGRALGMDDSHFASPNGWPDEGRSFVSARDLVTLAEALVTRHPALYARYFGQPGFSYNGVTQRNHDPISGVIAGADGIKTGYTREAGYNFLGSARRDGRRLVMVLAGIEGEEARARIARDYIEWGFAAFETRQAFAKGAVIARARVQNGDRRWVDLRAPRGIFVSLPKGGSPPIVMRLRYRGPVRAPFRAGDEIAELEIAVRGLQPYRVPLAAGADVEAANPVQRVVNAVLGLFS